jgi:transcriptional regulatory protein AMDR
MVDSFPIRRSRVCVLRAPTGNVRLPYLNNVHYPIALRLLIIVGDFSNLDESDAPSLEEHHFQGINSPEFDFTISHNRLCLIFSQAMRKRVTLRSTPTERAAATVEADAALANLVTHLPEKLHSAETSPDHWQAMFHLTYNNFLILLHRPSPSQMQDVECPSTAPDTDLSICCDAASTICSIFESLRKRNLLNRLWIPSIHVLFTALVHVSDQMHSPNPLIVAKSKRLFDSLILTLHALKGQWLYAHSLLAVFEGRNATNPRRTRTHGSGWENGVGEDRVAPHSGVSATFQPQPHLRNGEGVLNDSLATTHMSGVSHAVHGTSPPAYLGPTGLDQSDPGHGHCSMGGDVSQSNQIYATSFAVDGLGLGGDVTDLEMLQVPSALELLLAGVRNDFGSHY